jgi:hypothetical protein
MDNSMATKPYSKLKGDAYRAYEELPAEVRLALQEALVDWCPLRARALHLDLLRRERLRPALAASVLVQTIRGHDHAEVAAFARTWSKGAQAYPHLAAGATLQRYVGTEGIPAAKPILIAQKATQPKAAPSKAPPSKASRPKASQSKAARPKASQSKAARPTKAARPKARVQRPGARRSRR